jgi:carbonic anhydrase
MTTIDALIQSNKSFAKRGIHADLQLFPKEKTLVIGCVDPRLIQP